MSNLFVSFSGKDQHDVRKLFASLQLQGTEIWDYSSFDQELTLAQPLDKSLQERIDACDYFIAVVSANSTEEHTGHNTRLEVHYAVQRGLLQQGRLLPVLLINNPPQQWRDIYQSLATLVRAEIDPASSDSIEEGIHRICRWMSNTYVPPSLNDARVFFAHRFLREAQEADAIPLSNDKFFELMRIMNRCAEKVLREEWKGALDDITLFKLFSDSMAREPEHRFYYPQIIKGVCELQLQDYSRAEKTFLEASIHPLRDENAFAGLGHTYYARRLYSEAITAFQTALSLNPADRDIEFNILGTLLDSGEQVFDVAMLDHYDNLELSAAERFKVNKVKGIVLCRSNKYLEATKVFGSMNPEEMDDACVDYYSSALEHCGQKRKALAILKSGAARLDDTNLYHLLARAYLRHGEVEKAAQLYETLCVPQRRSRQYLIEYARLLKAFESSNNEKKIGELCKVVLSVRDFSECLTLEDFFYMGFANYLMGKDERARYDFERSSGFSDKYYDHSAYKL
ncbi:MAG: hypothetical protein JWM21_1077 [Acidobacteria bacterium]|nr:hypothetical protein [Acidobacteriota bacterium]